MIAKEAAESTEMETALTKVKSQRDSQEEERDRVRKEIEATQRTIAQRVEAQRTHAAHLDAQARFNSPELDFWTDHLCLQIDGTGQVDRLRFIFTHIDERDWEREAWFELCTEKRDYEILDCGPTLEPERIEQCADRLNETRDLGRFLKGIRELFIDAMMH